MLEGARIAESPDSAKSTANIRSAQSPSLRRALLTVQVMKSPNLTKSRADGKLFPMIVIRTPPVVGPLSGDTSSTPVDNSSGSASSSAGGSSRGRIRPSRSDNACCCPRGPDTLDTLDREVSAAADVPEETESVVAVMGPRSRFEEVQLARSRDSPSALLRDNADPIRVDDGGLAPVLR